ncbi:hypothetical protein HK102_010525 [Quaeritorhiza haematococci]|nr:hypothetical protein HK102_010525 [Quaeritorhiza haematococci]
MSREQVKVVDLTALAAIDDIRKGAGELTKFGAREAKKRNRRASRVEEEAEEEASQAVEGNGEERKVIGLTALATFDDIQKGADELADLGLVENGEVLVLKRLRELYPHYQQDVQSHLREEINGRKAKQTRKVVSVEAEEKEEQEEQSQAVIGVSEDQSEEEAQTEEGEKEDEEVDDNEDNAEWMEYGEQKKKKKQKTGRGKGARNPPSRSWQDALLDFDEKLAVGGGAEMMEMILKWRDGRARSEGDELTKLEGKVPIPPKMKGLREEIDGILRSVAEARDKDGGWNEKYVSKTQKVLMRLWKKLDADHADRVRRRRDGVDFGEVHGTQYFEHLRNEGEDWAFLHLVSIVYGIAWQLLFFNRKKPTNPPIDGRVSKTLVSNWLRTANGSKPFVQKCTAWYTLTSLWPHMRVLHLEVVFERLGIGTESMTRKINQY